MGLFNDTIASWKSVGEDGTPSVTLPDDWEQGLSGAYDADMTSAGDTAAAKIAELEAANAELSAQLQTTKAMNYDLIVNGPPITADSDPENSPNNAENADGDPDNPDDSDGGIDSLFEEDEEDR